MKINYSYLLLFLAIFAPVAAMADDPWVPDGYVKVWSDEFNGSSLNGDWTLESKPARWMNNELQAYKPEQAEVRDGSLKIHLEKDGSSYKSARLYAKQNEGWQYGYIEARMKLPEGRGTWPAFWMMPVNNDFNANPWPNCGEIDIMEEVGFAAGCVHSTIHCKEHNNGGSSAESGWKNVSTSESEYHVYGMKWTSSEMIFYIDGEAIFTYKNDGTGDYGWPFNKKYYIILNLAWGGDWGGQQGVDDSKLPNEMDVDYVRVYQPGSATDNSTDLGNYGSLALDNNNNTTFDFDNASNYVVVDASQKVKSAMGSNIAADYSVDYTKQCKWIWTDSYTIKYPSGVNSFGYAESWNDYYVNGTQNWSGLSYGSTSGNGKNLSMIDDDYYLHFSMRGTDLSEHCSHGIRIGQSYFAIGKSDFIDNTTRYPVIGDYKRDGRWCSFDIPVKKLKQLANPMFLDADGGASAYTGNVFAILSGGNYGNEAQFDNIFFYKKKNDVTAPAAPVPAQLASNVKSLYSDAYTTVAPSWSVGSWYQSTLTSQKELASGDNAYYNTKFNYLGFQFGSDSQTVDMSDMDKMHVDIFPMSDMTINIYPICKRADGTTNDTQKFSYSVSKGKWNSIDIDVQKIKDAGLDVSKSFQIKFDGGNGGNSFFLDNIYYWKNVPTVSAAPVPSQSASNVKSLYSDAYTSVAQSWSVGSWYQSTKTSEVELASGDKAYCNTNFNYLGFQFGSDSQTVDMSDMDHMHLDIYPTADMTINIYPITKRADWTTDDTQKFARTLEGGKWNSIDLNVSDFKAAGLDVSKSYQIKLDGGNGGNTFYLDNIYYWKEASVSGIPAAPVPTIYSAYVKSLYSDAYTSVAKDWKVGSWYQSTKTTEVQLASGDKSYYNTDFNYLGFQFGGDNDVIDVSSMFFLHFDIYPLSDMTINVYPITKKSDGSTDDTQRLSYTVTKGGWNQVNVFLPYFKNLGMDLSKNFQIKLDGGDGTQSFYLDNIYYWSYFSAGAKGNGATGITDMDASTDAKTFDVYSVDGQLVKQAATSLEGLPKGLYIVNGKKVAIK